MYGQLKCFIKSFTRLETSSTFLNSHQKILQKIMFYNFRSIESSFDRSNALFDRSSKNRIAIESSRDSRIIFFIISIDRANASTNQKYWISNFLFSLRKFQNLNFHFNNFMKQYSPNLNIIITTYPYIYLYMQQSPTRLE